MAPYYLDSRGWGMDQAFMLIVREGPTSPPTDAQLSQMQMTRAQLDALLVRLRDRQETALSRTGGGSYRVTLDRGRTTHADFGDLSLLNVPTDRDASHKRRVLSVVTEYTRAFFDRTLRGRHPRLLTEPPTSELAVRVVRFQPSRRGAP